MDKTTRVAIAIVIGVIATTSFFLALINVSYENSSPETDVSSQDTPPSSPPADSAQNAENAKDIQDTQDGQSAQAPADSLPQETGQDDKPDIGQLVSDLSAPLRYVKIVPGAPRLEEEKERSANYTVTVASHPPDIEDLFGMHEYTFDTGDDFSDMAALCRAIEAGSQPPPFELPKSKVIFEELYAISGLIDLGKQQADTPDGALSDTVAIFIQGYADGQATDWVRPLREGRYAYNAIDVYPPLASRAEQPAVFLHTPVTVKIPSAYKNSNLPDLRAQFIKDAILAPFLKECVDEHLSINILKGHAFPSPHNPLQRKVDVYVNFY